MGKGRETFGKKDVRSKKEKKRKEKELKRIERRETKGSGNPGDMIAYVDEFGNITSTPPDLTKRSTVKAEDIQIGVPRSLTSDLNDAIHEGIVKFFDDNKGYGFIQDSENKVDIFVHISGVIDPVKEGNKVTFEVVKGINGRNAVNVKIVRE
ncbi:MAG TPA: cold shock domain-containing protein [Bacteroidales bacterium]|nr:cold shock domain-containing protein [Bacteroidales bacterium]HNS46309.1 cold shock domain-containing protein [Bacteroidales bacterium]